MLAPKHSDKPMLVVLLLASEVVAYSPRGSAGEGVGRVASIHGLCEAERCPALVRRAGSAISEGILGSSSLCRVMV